MWKKICLLPMLFLLFFQTSCSQGEHRRDVATLRINFQEGVLPTIHPQDTTIYLRGISLAKALYEGLTRIDSQGNPVLAGAASVDISEDQCHYTFHLRDHLWSDGSPVTAYQYEASWKALLAPTSTAPRAELLFHLKNGEEAKKGLVPLDSVGVEALDANTLSVELAAPTPFFLRLLAQPTCFPLRDPSVKHPKVFNGAFVVDPSGAERMLTLKKNPHFWNREQVRLDRIDISAIQDLSAVYRMYQEKLLDWIGVPLSPMTLEQIGAMKEIDQARVHPVHRFFWIFLNVDHPLLSSKTIRKAFALAVDRRHITENILVEGRPLFKPIPPVQLPEEFSASLDENWALAKELFEQGLQELGLERKNLPPLTCKHACQAGRKQLAEWLCRAWSELFDIEVAPQQEEWSVLRMNLAEGRFDISGGAYDAPFYGDPFELLERFASQNMNNFSRWTHPEYTALIQQAKQEKSPERRMELLGSAEKFLLEEMPVIPLCTDRFLFSHIPGLEGYAFDSVGAIDLTYAGIANE